MQVFDFACPHCATRLRVQGREHVGRRVNCPDCQRPLVIQANGVQGISAQAAEVPSAEAAASQTNRRRWMGQKLRPWTFGSSAPAKMISAKMRPIVDAAKSPVGIAWGVALLCTVSVVLAILSSRSGSSTRRQRLTDNASTEVASESPSGESDQVSVDAEAVVVDAESAGGIEGRMKRLGTMLTDYYREHQQLPSGTVATEGLPPAERLSWLAELATDLDGRGGPQPVWGATWRDPLNDRFVRRRLDEFQNPLIAQLATPNGYPASHFVGMAGVGEDAPFLAVDHPRAGVFGYSRRTQMEDIRDGTSNTIIVGGINDQIGGWAAGGPSTVRGFTQEPYVNGPDGFGTGQPNGMYVLMADGSVRFVSQNTDPVILLRMAAMADGLPLDPNVPGRPGESLPSPDPQLAADEKGKHPDPVSAESEVIVPAPPPPPPPPGEKPPMENPPPDPNLVVEAVLQELDIERGLSQPIAEFKQAKAVPLATLVDLLEEMAGVPIEFDETIQIGMLARMNQPIRLSLENTTLGAILQSAIEQAGFAYAVEKNRVRIHADEAREE